MKRRFVSTRSKAAFPQIAFRRSRRSSIRQPLSSLSPNNGEEHMNTKRWLLASVAVFVVIGVLEFLVHGVLLSGLYKQTASVWRVEAEMRQMMWIFWVGYVVFAPFFTLVYAKG